MTRNTRPLRLIITIIVFLSGFSLLNLGCRKRPYRHLTDSFEGNDNRKKTAALEKLRKLGKQAHSAAPEVGQLLYKKKFRRQAARTLATMGEKAVPTLTYALRDKDSELREIVADALSEIGPPAKPSLSRLKTMLSAKRELEKQAALRAIASIGPDGDSLRAMKSLLKDESRVSRYLVAKAMSQGGKLSHPYIPELMKLSQDKYYKTREAAIAGLCQLGPKATPYLEGLLTSDETSVRDVHRKYFLLKQLHKFKTLPKVYMPKIILMLGYDSGHASSLTVMGLASNAAVRIQTMKLLLKHPTTPNQKQTIRAKLTSLLPQEQNKSIKTWINKLLQSL